MSLNYIFNHSGQSVENVLQKYKIGGIPSNYIALGSGWVMTMVAQPGEVSDKNSRYDILN